MLPQFLQFTLKKTLYTIGFTVLSGIVFAVINLLLVVATIFIPHFLLYNGAIYTGAVSLFTPSISISSIGDSFGGIVFGMLLMNILQLIYIYLLVSSVFYYKGKDTRKMLMAIITIIALFGGLSLYILLKNG